MTRYLLSLFICFCLLFAACRSDDELVVANCNNGGFSVDLSLRPTFGVPTFSYLADVAGNTVFEEDLTGSNTTGLIFLNAGQACEDRYTTGAATYFSFPNGEGARGESFEVGEVANVPNGMGLEVITNPGNVPVFSIPAQQQLAILNCPPIDSVRLEFSPRFGAIPETPPFSINYNVADNLLTIITLEEIFTSESSILLALRQSDNQDWRGTLVNVNTSTGTEVDFATMPTFLPLDVTIESAEETEVDIYFIVSESDQGIVHLGHSKDERITVLRPASSTRYLIKILSPIDQGFYRSQHIYDELPTTLQLEENLSLENARLVPPLFTAQASGGDIFKVTGFNFDPDLDFSNTRTVTFPATEGENRFNFPKTIALLDAVGTDINERNQSAISRSGVSNNLTVELTYYPAIQGDYDVFLRRIIGTPSSRSWLMRQEFERIERYF